MRNFARIGLLASLAACGGEQLADPVTPQKQIPAAQASQQPQASVDEASTRRVGVMGTELVITVRHADAALRERALDEAVAEINRVEDLMTDWRASPLTTLNQAAGEGPHSVPRELYELIERALLISELSEGAFDPTFRTFGRLWDFKAEPPQIPTAEAVAEAVARCGWQKVELIDGKVRKPEGLEIGLGGIAKGYGVDRAMQVLMDHGIEHAIVNAGGDLKALGRNGDELWTIAIRHPREQQRVLAVLPVSNSCVVTSGDYERFFEVDGRRYHHILDPRTGYPATGAMSATVIAPDAAVADALATSLCVLGPESLAIIEELPRCEALLVDLDGKVHTTSGLNSAVER